MRPLAIARPLACQGYWATSTSRPSRFAWSAVRPAQAISGSVKTTAGMAALSNAAGSPARTSAATLPSCDALWASIGSPATSPIARMCGSLVRCCSSTATKPLSLILTLVFSSPKPFDLGRRPDGDQHAVVAIGELGAIGAFHVDFDFVARRL